MRKTSYIARRKYMMRKVLLFTLVITILLLPGEGWWGGAVNFGNRMPMGKDSFSFNLYGDKSYNQSTPLLISTQGRWLWSEEPFRYTFRNDSLIVDSTNNEIQTGQNGSSIAEAYRFVSKRFFPATRKWPDSLLITAPQYNLWIELVLNPTQADVYEYARQVLANGLPPGVLMIDDNWTNYYGEFDFDRKKFPDAKMLIRMLHNMNFKVMLWISPFISPDSAAYHELSQKKLLLLDNEGNKDLSWSDAQKPLLIEWWAATSACLDLTNPEARLWLKEKLNKLQKEYGVDGFKFDAGDATFYDSPNLLSYKKVSPNQHTIEWGKVGLQYKLNEYRAMWKMAGQPLVQRLADKSHSWEELQVLIPQTIAQQLAGYTFTCPDMIGGGNILSFKEGAEINQELVVRSAQCHALMPMMQFSVAPWRILNKKHFSAVKKAVELRQEYLPYIIESIDNSVARGVPALKPLEFDYPNQGYDIVKDQFLMGETLMVAPVVTSNNKRDVIFPPGNWEYKGEIFTGPSRKKFKVPLDEILIFKKQK